MTLTTLPTFGMPEQQQIAALTSGQLIYYIYERISYSDIFDRQHTTTFCYFVLKTLTQLNTCETYNSAD